MDSFSEWKLKSLVSQLSSIDYWESETEWVPEWVPESKFISVISEIILVVSSMDLDMQPKPETKFMWLATQTISLFQSMDLDSLPKPVSRLISLISKKIPHVTSIDSDSELISLMNQAMTLRPRPELMQVIHPLLTLVESMDPNSELESVSEWSLISRISQLISFEYRKEPESKMISLISGIIFLAKSVEFSPQQRPQTKFRSLISQTISVFESMDLASQPKPLSEFISLLSLKIPSVGSESFISLFKQTSSLKPRPELMSLIFDIVTLVGSMDPNSESETVLESKLTSLISQLSSMDDDSMDSEIISVISHINSLAISMEFFPQPRPQSKFRSLVTQVISVFNSMDLDSQPKPLSKLVRFVSKKICLSNSPELIPLIDKTLGLAPKPELMSLIHQIVTLVGSMDLDLDPASLGDETYRLEQRLVSLISALISVEKNAKAYELDTEVISLIIPIISVVQSMDLDSQPKKPESELRLLVKKTISVFNSMDLNSQPKPLLDLIALISQEMYKDSDSESKSEWESDSDSESNYNSLVYKTIRLKPEPELISVIHQVVSLAISMKTNTKLVSLCPQAIARLKNGKYFLRHKMNDDGRWGCFSHNWETFSFSGEDNTHLFCRECFGKNHIYNKAPVEIKAALHPKHFLQLVLLDVNGGTRECYCCDEDIKELFYYCSACDFAMNIACVEKPPVLSKNHPKWHQHTLALFPSQATIPCNLCALPNLTSCPLYICPPCDFVVHQSCLSLPRVIRISRHLHRISFTHSFEKGDWSCHLCRTKINNDYGGYSCIKEGCSYAAHSRCATQTNVWDGIDLEGVPEETEEEELEPFVRISDGIIQHFSHPHHHLRLDDDTDRDYDENKQCQACTMPIYVGNFYSCMHCDFILHEACANFSRKIHNPIHPHMLTLEGGYNGVMNFKKHRCSACSWVFSAGFFYECRKMGCYFKLHVQCATISEPLAHGSHKHPLFLTSKPGDRRTCCVCKRSDSCSTNETFNCIRCDYALCFGCATLPEKVRYKHDKHMLTLSYGEETSAMAYWCEVCEEKVSPEARFYMCGDNCCVTLHIECLIGKDLYLKPGSLWFYSSEVNVVSNNQHMTRPICSCCEKRCPYKIAFECCELIYCDTDCIRDISMNDRVVLA